ncbi:hypothetical protein FRB94_007792 [Tulasnella sp. JGI-2019a]|nr:hypothetical protein FRB94_007792 [Tulasnella sp. JGI-2019a]
MVTFFAAVFAAPVPASEMPAIHSSKPTLQRRVNYFKDLRGAGIATKIEQFQINQLLNQLSRSLGKGEPAFSAVEQLSDEHFSKILNHRDGKTKAAKALKSIKPELESIINQPARSLNEGQAWNLLVQIKDVEVRKVSIIKKFSTQLRDNLRKVAGQKKPTHY